MKRCICKAISPNLGEISALADELTALGLNPVTVGHELSVEFNDNALLQAVIDMFDEFDQHSYHVDF